ncbi:hypothetical protein HDV05_002210 [Chytridiales sp. JEL 0842]|nr:hypothetical protein HDV05_002210 [Chytridiales sp. JEL 0842]
MLPEAMADFTDALAYLRGNLLIDYTQLGVPFKLYACEVSYNRGLCFAAVGQVDACMADFDDADRTRPLDSKTDYSRISEALDLGERAPEYCKPFYVPSSLIFRPPEGKIKNTKKVNYLGNSKVVASVDERDGFTGFSGTKLKAEGTLARTKTAGPLDKENNFSRGATLARSKTEIPSSSSLARRPSNNTPSSPSLGADLSPSKSAPSRSNSGRDIGSMIQSRKSSMSISSINQYSSRSPPGPARNNSFNDLPSPQSSSRYDDRDRRPSERASPRGGRDDDYDDYDRPRGRNNSDDDSRGNYDRARSRGRSPNQSSRPYDTPERTSTPNSTGRRSVANVSVTSSSTYAPGERVKIKCHYTDTRIILVPLDVSFNDLQSRIQRKFGAPGPLKLKYKDSDEEMVLMTDQEDLEIAFEMNGIEYGAINVGNGNDKMEVWCFL